jgi:hypothetical protein
MKRKGDGWHSTLMIDGSRQNCFSYLGRIARHTPENDPDFYSKVDFLVDALRIDLRPGKLKKNGEPHAYSVLSRWLCDVCNHYYSGRWSGNDISEGHLNKVAEKLGWPEVWKRGGDVMYCVDCGDFMTAMCAIDGIESNYPKRRRNVPLSRDPRGPK